MFNRLSPVLQEFMGLESTSRGEVSKKLWQHIKANNLQDPNNGQNIICDAALTKIFQRKTVTMFSMNKHLSKHIKSPELLS